MISTINIYDHKKSYGQNADEHSRIKDYLRQTISETISPVIDWDRLDVFNLTGEAHTFNAGKRTRAIILINSGMHNNDAPPVETTLKFDGVAEFTTNVIAPVETVQGDGILNITDENGTVVAQYSRSYNEMYILFDVFPEDNVKNRRKFKAIINQWVEKDLRIRELENSWKHTSDKAGLTSRFTRRLKEQSERAVRDDKHMVERYEQDIRDYTAQLKSFYDNLIITRNRLELQEKNVEGVLTKFIEQLDILATNPKISDLHIKDGLFIVHIPDVYIHSDKGKRYYGGNYKVTINMENTEVRFYGDNKRGSFWSSDDPHPHVNGRDGTACLGNISATIAELCSRNEIYALVLTCIDFLENANTGDTAGRRVCQWDEVDEAGKVIKKGYPYNS